MSAPTYKPHAPTPLSPCPMDAGVVIVKMECGCTVEGCGHLPDPVRPKLCAKHAAAPNLLAVVARLVEDPPACVVRREKPAGYSESDPFDRCDCWACTLVADARAALAKVAP